MDAPNPVKLLKICLKMSLVLGQEIRFCIGTRKFRVLLPFLYFCEFLRPAPLDFQYFYVMPVFILMIPVLLPFSFLSFRLVP